MDQLYNLTTALTDVFAYIRNNEGKLGGAGRRLTASSSKQPTAVTLVKAFVRSCDKVLACLVLQPSCCARAAWRLSPGSRLYTLADLSYFLDALGPWRLKTCAALQPATAAAGGRGIVRAGARTGACVTSSVLPPRPSGCPQIKAGLQAPELQSANTDLTAIFGDVDTIGEQHLVRPTACIHVCSRQTAPTFMPHEQHRW